MFNLSKMAQTVQKIPNMKNESNLKEIYVVSKNVENFFFNNNKLYVDRGALCLLVILVEHCTPLPYNIVRWSTATLLRFFILEP